MLRVNISREGYLFPLLTKSKRHIQAHVLWGISKVMHPYNGKKRKVSYWYVSAVCVGHSLFLPDSFSLAFGPQCTGYVLVHCGLVTL